MSVVINSNSAATMAANNLAESNASLQRSLNRLSSGSKIVSPSDDAGGLAVSSKLAATIHRQAAVATNLSNSVSYLQTQDGALNVVGQVLTRMSELKTLYADPTKNSSDLANYDAEFTELQSQLSNVATEQFNGISLFGTAGITVGLTESGTTTANVGTAALLGAGAAFSPFADTLANFSNWTDTSAAPATANAAGGVMSLNNTSGGVAIATTNQSFTGAMDMKFQVNLGSDNGIFNVSVGGSSVLNAIVGNSGGQISGGTWHSVHITIDGSGNYSSYLDGSSTAFQSASLGAAPSGALAFAMQGGTLAAATQIRGGTGAGTALTVTSTGGGSNVSTVTNATNLAAVDQDTLTSALQDVATLRAKNGASQSRLGFSAELLTTNKSNLEAANSRITDVDVAQESTQLARFNILVQAGTSMLSQANQMSQAALKLLG